MTAEFRLDVDIEVFADWLVFNFKILIGMKLVIIPELSTETGYCCPSGFYYHENKRQWYVDGHFHHLDNGGAYKTFFAERWKFVTKVNNKIDAMTKGMKSSTEENRAIINRILKKKKK